MMKKISINHPDTIKETLLALKLNKIIVYPTDTIYGIGTDINNDEGINRINHLKGRTSPMSIIAPNFHSIVDKLILNEDHKDKLLPIIDSGNTVIIEFKKGAFNSLITKDYKIGFRVPNDQFLKKVLQEHGSFVTTTSINLTGEKPLNDPEEIEKKFGHEIDLLIDGGKIHGKSASAIYIFEKNKITQIR